MQTRYKVYLVLLIALGLGSQELLIGFTVHGVKWWIGDMVRMAVALAIYDIVHIVVKSLWNRFGYNTFEEDKNLKHNAQL